MSLSVNGLEIEVVGREITGRPVVGRSRRSYGPLLLGLPAVLLGGLLLVPILVTAYAAFHTPTGLGLGNFTEAFHTDGAGPAIWHSAGWIVVALALVVLGFGIALVGHRVPWLWRVLQPALVIPFAMSALVAGTAFRIVFDPAPERGTVTAITTGLFGSSPVWLGPRLIWVVLISAFAWTWLGFAASLFRAGLDAIPDDVIRTVRAEGLRRWRRLRTVELPILRPISGVVVVTLVVAAVRLFDLVLVAVPAPVQDEANVLSLHWWRVTNTATDAGPPAALALVLFVVAAAVALLGVRGLRRSWAMPAVAERPAAPPRPSAPSSARPGSSAPSPARPGSPASSPAPSGSSAAPPGSSARPGSPASSLVPSGSAAPPGSPIPSSASPGSPTQLGSSAPPGSSASPGSPTPSGRPPAPSSVPSGSPAPSPAPSGSAAPSRSAAPSGSPAPPGSPAVAEWPAAPPGRAGDRRHRLLGFVVGLPIGLLWAFPALVLVTTAFHDQRAAGLSGWWHTTGRGLDSFRAASNAGLWHVLLVSLVVAGLATAVVLAVAVPTAYLLAWGGLPPRLGKAVTTGFVVLAVAPVQMYADPLRDAFTYAGLSASRIPLAFVHASAGLPFAVLLLRAAFASAPANLVAGALLGRLGQGRVLNQVQRTYRPAVVAVAVLEFVLVWNDFIVGFLIAGPGSTTSSLLLWGEARQFATSAGTAAAAATLSSCLPVALLLVFWPTVVRGLTVGTRP